MDNLKSGAHPPSPGLQTPHTLCSRSAAIWGNSGDNPSVMLVPGFMRDRGNLGTFWGKEKMRWWQPEARPPPVGAEDGHSRARTATTQPWGTRSVAA